MNAAGLLLGLATVLAPPQDGSVEGLTKDLKNRDRAVVQRALKGLAAHGPAGVNALLEAVDHKQTWVRAAALRQLVQVGQPAHPALGPAFAVLAEHRTLETLAFEDAVQALAGYELLATMAALMKPSEQKLSKKEQAQRDEQDLRFAALTAVQGLGAFDLDDLLRRTRELAGFARGGGDGYSDVRVALARAVGGLAASSERVLPWIRERLSDPDPELRALGLLCAAACGTEGLGLSSELELALAAPEPAVRSRALEALAAVGATPDELRAAAKPALDDPHLAVRLRAAHEWLEAGGDALRAMPVLLEACEAPSMLTRASAARTLGQVSSPPESAVDELERLLQDGEGFVRLKAVGTFSTWNHRPRSVVKRIERMAEKDKDPRVRKAAQSYLGGSG